MKKSRGYTSLCAEILQLSQNDKKKLFSFLKDILSDDAETTNNTKFVKGQEVAFIFDGILRKGRVDKVYTNHMIVADADNKAYMLNMNGDHQIIVVSHSKK